MTIQQYRVQKRLVLADMAQCVETIDSLEQFVRDNWIWLFPCEQYKIVEDSDSIKFVDIEFTVDWFNHVRNSHCCPKGGVTNWSSRESFDDGTLKPTGYLGWYGRVNYKISPYSNRYSGLLFRETPIHTGSGGTWQDGWYAYDVKLFSSEFPTMTYHTQRQRTWQALCL